MGRKQKGGGSLGSALKKDKNKSSVKKADYIKTHKQEDTGVDTKAKAKLVSVVERDDVNDFLYNAELKQQKFDAVKQRKLITTDSIGTQVVIDLATGNADGPSDELMRRAKEEMDSLRIPRRPAWDGKRTGADQRLLENTVYVDWRRDLAALEEKYRFVHVTPYEKNIEIWRQLWIVIERSDILVQIVDCRDPMFFRCPDLEHYVKEVGKEKVNFLLLNKADLLDETIRQVWSEYLTKQNIQHIFFSAKQQQSHIDRDGVEEQVVQDLSGVVNTSKIVDRGTLKAILKKIVNDFKATHKHEKEAHQQTEGSKAGQPTHPAPSQPTHAEHKHSQPAQPHPNPAPAQASQPAEPTSTSAQPKSSKIKILKVMPSSEPLAKDVKTVNLIEAIHNLEGTEECEDSHECEDCGDCEDCKGTDGKKKEGKMETVKEKGEHAEHDHDDDDDSEDGDEEGEEEQEPVPVDIYTKLGVDRHHLVSKPFFEKRDENTVSIGMIGFPNVGKSSVINVLCNKKLVGVGARPGKTKNFQTIFLEKDLILCDCPGLVFPSIVDSKPKMIINSVIAIDNVKEFMGPMSLICKHIPTRVIEYVLKCPMFCKDKYIEAGRMLHVYAKNRGIISGSGMPNYSEAAKIVLKKYVHGDLLYATLPPGIEENAPESLRSHQYNKVPEDYIQTTPESITTEIEKQYVEEHKQLEADMDDEYFVPDIDVNEILEKLSQEDVIELVMGKKIQGIKLDKIQRREMKFAIKRDAPSEEIWGMLGSFLGGDRKKFVNLKKPSGPAKV